MSEFKSQLAQRPLGLRAAGIFGQKRLKSRIIEPAGVELGGGFFRRQRLRPKMRATHGDGYTAQERPDFLAGVHGGRTALKPGCAQASGKAPETGRHGSNVMRGLSNDGGRIARKIEWMTKISFAAEPQKPLQFHD